MPPQETTINILLAFSLYEMRVALLAERRAQELDKRNAQTFLLEKCEVGVRWGGIYLVGASQSSMRPLMKEARAAEASLMASASLEMVSFCISSSSTLALWAFSEGIMIDDLVALTGKMVCIVERSSQDRKVYDLWKVRDRESNPPFIES